MPIYLPPPFDALDELWVSTAGVIEAKDKFEVLIAKIPLSTAYYLIKTPNYQESGEAPTGNSDGSATDPGDGQSLHGSGFPGSLVMDSINGEGMSLQYRVLVINQAGDGSGYGSGLDNIEGSRYT